MEVDRVHTYRWGDQHVSVPVWPPLEKDRPPHPSRAGLPFPSQVQPVDTGRPLIEGILKGRSWALRSYFCNDMELGIEALEGLYEACSQVVSVGYAHRQHMGIPMAEVHS